MAKYFDEEKWEKAAKYADWYLQIQDEYQALMKLAEEKPEFKDEIKNEVRLFFAQLIEQNKLTLGGANPKLDEERKPIDTIVIHHTSNKPNYPLALINATHLLNIYVPYFANPNPKNEHLKGSPITSNHLWEGRPVFYAYHWLVKMDGSTIRLLEDQELGWHAGNWEVNCRSVAICLDNDYENSTPDDLILKATAELIKKEYSFVKPDRILGHREVNEKTVCPGNTFLIHWKQKLIKYVVS